jgi:hypothetical protein
MENSWWAGIKQEWFNQGPFGSREEAIREGTTIWGGESFWIGRQVEYEPFSRDWVEQCLELEACDVNDECGPGASDNWPPRIGKEAGAEANAKIAAILKELCGDCPVSPIENSEEITPTSLVAYVEGSTI